MFNVVQITVPQLPFISNGSMNNTEMEFVAFTLQHYSVLQQIFKIPCFPSGTPGPSYALPYPHQPQHIKSSTILGNYFSYVIVLKYSIVCFIFIYILILITYLYSTVCFLTFSYFWVKIMKKMSPWNAIPIFHWFLW